MHSAQFLKGRDVSKGDWPGRAIPLPCADGLKSLSWPLRCLQMHGCQFLESVHRYLRIGRNNGLPGDAVKGRQDIAERSRRSAHLLVFFKEEAEMIMRKRELRIKVDGLTQRSL